MDISAIASTAVGLLDQVLQPLPLSKGSETLQLTNRSAFATNLIIEESKVTITGTDNLTCYEDGESLSGNIVKRYFCKTCGK